MGAAAPPAREEAPARGTGSRSRECLNETEAGLEERGRHRTGLRRGAVGRRADGPTAARSCFGPTRTSSGISRRRGRAADGPGGPTTAPGFEGGRDGCLVDGDRGLRAHGDVPILTANRMWRYKFGTVGLPFHTPLADRRLARAAATASERRRWTRPQPSICGVPARVGSLLPRWSSSWRPSLVGLSERNGEAPVTDSRSRRHAPPPGFSAPMEVAP